MIKTYLDGKEAQPANIAELILDFTFDPFNSPNALPIELNKLEFLKSDGNADGINIINSFIEQFGVFNGIPVEIKDSVTGINFTPNTYLDPASPENEYFKQEAISLELKDAIQGFQEQANALNMRTLTGVQTRQMGYILRGVPEYWEAAILSLATFIIVKTAIDAAKETARAAIDLLNNGLDSVGAGLRAAAQLIAAGIYIAALVIAAKDLLERIGDALFQVPKFWNCANVKSCLEIGAQKLGYSFSSTLFDGDYSNAYVIPKTEQPEGNNALPNESFGSFLSKWAAIFNAKARVNLDTKEIVFERVDFFRQNPVQYDIPQLYNLGTFTYNLSELPKSYKVEFINDSTDNNSVLRNGSRLVVNYELSGVLNPSQDGLKGKREITIPYARVERKNSETDGEKFFNSIYDLWQDITGGRRFGSRTGYAFVEQGVIGEDRVVILNADGRINQRNLDILNTSYLFDNYHEIESPAKNQWLNYSNPDEWQAVVSQDVVNLRNNNVISNNGRLTILERLKFNPAQRTFNVPFYRVKQNYIDASLITETRSNG